MSTAFTPYHRLRKATASFLDRLSRWIYPDEIARIEPHLFTFDISGYSAGQATVKWDRSGYLYVDDWEEAPTT